MRNAIVAAVLLGGMCGVPALAQDRAQDRAQDAGVAPQPRIEPEERRLPVADLSDPDLIYDPETDTYYDPDTGDVFAAPAPLPASPGAPAPQNAQAPIPTNFGPLQTGLYAGVGMDTLEFQAYGISGKVGYDFNRYFSVEAQLGFGVADDEEVIQDVQVPFINGAGLLQTLPAPSRVATGYDGFIAAFAVARAPIGDKIELLGRAGYHFTGLGGSVLSFYENDDFPLEVQNSRFFTEFDASTSGFAVGAGIQYNFGDFDLQAIRLDYTYLDMGTIDEADVSVFDDDVLLQPGGLLDNGLNFLDGGSLFSASLVQRF